MRIQDLKLIHPLVILKNRFMNSFSNFLLTELGEFKQEEGGYLLGTFVGDFINVEGYYHDSNANRSYGEVKLSTEAFSKALEIADKNDEKLEIIGTWHTHPPSFGSQYSQVDTEVLFIDRMVLNASDPSDYKKPQIHLILSGKKYGDYTFYTLSVDPKFHLDPISRELKHKSAINLPPNKVLGVKIKKKKLGYDYLPYSPRVFGYALKNQTLEGLWRFCEKNSANLKWELVFIENFIRNLLSIIKDSNDIVKPAQLKYFRIFPDVNDDFSVEEYIFTLPDEPSSYVFEKINSVLEDSEKGIIIENPQRDPVMCIITSKTKVSELVRHIQKEMDLDAPPLIWTLISPEASIEYNNITKVDKFGKIIPPDDVKVEKLLAQRLTPETPLYWTSSELNLNLVYDLRIHRFEQLYDELNLFQDKKILIAGMGLLGCEIAFNLATLGVRNISILDNGYVDWVNIYRQSLYDFRDVGKTKVLAASEKIVEMGINVNALELTIPSVLIDDVEDAYHSLEFLYDLLEDVDLVVGTLDSYSTRAVLQILCKILDKPFLSASLDYLPQLSLTQGVIQLFHSSIDRCYGCGSKLKTQKDRGVCTITPIEYPKIVGGIATRLIIENFCSLEKDLSVEYKVYDDYRIERSVLNKGENKCELLGFYSLTDKSLLFEKIVNWLIM